jgi:hypothetical protein
MAATKEDATLVVQLLSWGTQMGLQDALNHLLQEGFNPEQVQASEKSVQTVLLFGETIGTLVKQGLLDSGLVDDLFWIEGIWARVGPAARRFRETMGEPRLYENFEALAAR